MTIPVRGEGLRRQGSRRLAAYDLESKATSDRAPVFELRAERIWERLMVRTLRR
jgi:hypothetical protein